MLQILNLNRGNVKLYQIDNHLSSSSSLLAVLFLISFFTVFIIKVTSDELMQIFLLIIGLMQNGIEP